MPPKPIAKGGKDIRMFFGGSNSAKSSQNKSSQGSSSLSAKTNGASQPDKAGGSSKISTPNGTNSQPIELSDDDEPKKVTKKPSPKKVVELPSSGEDAESASAPVKLKTKPSKRKLAVDSSSESEEEDKTPPKKKAAAGDIKPKPRASTSSTKKGKKKAVEDDDDFEDDDEEEEKPKVKKARPSAGSEKAKGKKKAKDEDEDMEVDEVKPSVKKSSEDKKGGKPGWIAAKATKLAGPSNPGSKSVPDGDENALLGLTFVFTGELSAFSREEAQDLAKRFGGRVTGQPSSKTSFVVVGDGAGPSKLKAIDKHGLNKLDEDGFLDLIQTRKGPRGKSGNIDKKTKEKMEKEEKKVREGAEEMERAESSSEKKDPTSQLWTTRYAPQSLKDVCGNKGQVEKMLLWLQEWDKSIKAGFRKPGKNMMNTFRAILVTGPPGIGKTTSAHLTAKLAGFSVLELNASDVRSKKLVENGMNINNKSLDGWFGGNEASSSTAANADNVMITSKSCLIMDEVDGMSAGDRGGVGALNALIKKTKIPIICIANDARSQKLSPLKNTCYHMSFQRPPAQQVRSRIMSVVFKEKMKVPGNVIDNLIQGAQSDIRLVLNMLSTWRLSQDKMDYDESKKLTKQNEKYAILTPFDITSKLLGPYLFSATSREKLSDKMEYYFQDHSFVPMFVQENYLKPEPAKLKNTNGPEKDMRLLDLMDKAASSISDGDLVDAMIHSPEQHWSLMPLHAVCSTVRPASFMYGMGAHWGNNPVSFPQWLGQNSKQSKLSRSLTDVQIRMRLRTTGDKSEIRAQYIPALFSKIVKPITDEGIDAIPGVIEQLDEYYLSKDEWDAIVELGVGDHNDDLVLKKIPGNTKSALTRKYNSTEHPVAFHKATELGKPMKKLAGGPAPDLEEVYELDDDVEELSDEDSKPKKKKTEVALDDKLVKQPGKKGKNGGAKGKGKK